MPLKINERPEDKISTICTVLLDGINPEFLKEWYSITDDEIAQAKRRIELLKEVKNRA